MGVYIVIFAFLLGVTAWRGTVGLFFGSIASVFGKYEGLIFWVILSIILGVLSTNDNTRDVSVSFALLIALSLLIRKKGTIDKIMQQVV